MTFQSSNTSRVPDIPCTGKTQTNIVPVLTSSPNKHYIRMLCYLAAELEFVHRLIPTRKRAAEDDVAKLVPVPGRTNDTMMGKGPRAALRSIGFGSMPCEQRQKWFENARINSILGSCSRSLPQVRAGIRCFLAFAGMFTPSVT